MGGRRSSFLSHLALKNMLISNVRTNTHTERILHPFFFFPCIPFLLSAWGHPGTTNNLPILSEPALFFCHVEVIKASKMVDPSSYHTVVDEHYVRANLVDQLMNGGSYLSLRPDLTTYSLAARVESVLPPCVGVS